MVSCFFKNRWGRGQPDDIGAINLGDEKFDPDSDKKPRAGQILWIRGLTRLQTQVIILISLSISFYLCLSFYLSLFSLSFSHISSLKINILSRVSFITNRKASPSPIQQVRGELTHEPFLTLTSRISLFLIESARDQSTFIYVERMRAFNFITYHIIRI